ncbi:alpha/beta fold hydrolase [Kitasatospora phosalacinea]|uniref:alpha/beta fold hydrolase n=1 Tax=Kitasatospora phosalacinea TaxID=2065 RepID=UPI0035DBD589
MTIFPGYDGTALHYEQLGDGETLVAIPGGPGADARYLGDLGGLDARRRLVRFDPRGCGRSATPADRASCAFAAQAADVEALREHLGADRIDLLGHSAGALTAQRYAAEFPHRVRSLVLVTPVGRAAREPDPAELAALRAARADEPWYPDAAEADALLAAGAGDPAALAGRITPFFWGTWNERARTAAFDPELAPAAPWMREAFYASTSTNTSADGVGLGGRVGPEPVAAPVLVVAGERDGMIGTAPARLVAALHPNARLAVLPGVGHRPWVEDPAGFAALVGGFLDGA